MGTRMTKILQFQGILFGVGKLAFWRKVSGSWYNLKRLFKCWKNWSRWSQRYFYLIKRRKFCWMSEWKGCLQVEARSCNNTWNFVFIWPGKFFFYKGKVRESWKGMSVANWLQLIAKGSKKKIRCHLDPFYKVAKITVVMIIYSMKHPLI